MTTRRKFLIWGILTAVLLAAGAAGWLYYTKFVKQPEHVLIFESTRYPETAAHIRDAIAAGESDSCTIDRKGADKRRDQSLKGVPTKPGYDRDEWPMAMCMEGGKGADIRYISPSDNRGAGSWVSNKLEEYKDGTKVKFVVK